MESTTLAANATNEPVISGVVQLWLYDCAAVSAPSELSGVPIQSQLTACEKTTATTWFQGHLFASQGERKQYSVLGVPAQAPPPIHGCMVSEHDKPTYYDIYISEYHDTGAQVKVYALNVERSGGSGDAIELSLETTLSAAAQSTTNAFASTAMRANSLKLSTTRLLTGNRAQQHLAKYAPDALEQLADGDAVVCLGVVSIH